MALKREQRTFVAGVELRADGDDDALPKIVGYAAVFDKESNDLGGFVEIIRKGAFTKTVKEADVRALLNHDPNLILGRTKSGTLKISEDQKGLKIEIEPPDTQVARDLVKSIERGDVDQMSFAFRTVKDAWVQREGQVPLRELLEVRLYDVSPVTYPAYEDTEVSVRDLVEGRELTDDERLALRGLIGEELRQPDASGEAAPITQEAEPPPAGHSLDLKHRRLDLLAHA